jgi:hypothetical protein
MKIEKGNNNEAQSSYERLEDARISNSDLRPGSERYHGVAGLRCASKIDVSVKD